MIDALHAKLAAALRRVVPYGDRVPPTVFDDVREALAEYDRASREVEIVQTTEGEKARAALRSMADRPGERHDD